MQVIKVMAEVISMNNLYQVITETTLYDTVLTILFALSFHI